AGGSRGGGIPARPTTAAGTAPPLGSRSRSTRRPVISASAASSGRGAPGRDMEELFSSVARATGLLIEAAVVMVVTFGAAEAFIGLVGLVLRPTATHGVRKAVWRRFGTWLLLGLEFALAA